MGGTIRARVRGGVLEPLERTDLPEGKEVLITVIGVAEDLDDEAFLRSAGSWKGLIDAEKFIRDVYEEPLTQHRFCQKFYERAMRGEQGKRREGTAGRVAGIKGW